MKSSALFSECRTYRYALWRVWDESLDSILFIGLNPSTADESHNDPTISRCINFAKNGVMVVYAWQIFLHIELLSQEL